MPVMETWYKCPACPERFPSYDACLCHEAWHLGMGKQAYRTWHSLQDELAAASRRVYRAKNRETETAADAAAGRLAAFEGKFGLDTEKADPFRTRR